MTWELHPLTIRQRSDEAAISAFLRFSLRCGARTPHGFARALGLSITDLRAGRGTEKLASIAGLNGQELSWNSAKVDAGKRRISMRGQTLLLGDWSLSRRRWCADCLACDRALAEQMGLPDTWWITTRSWWAIHSVPSCPTHRRKLLDRCWRCTASQPWNGNLNFCNCGADLRHHYGAAWNGSAAEYILGRLGFNPRSTVSVLDALPLNHAIRALEIFGVSAAAATGNGHRAKASDRHEDREAGYEIAASWPDAFNRVLDELTAQRTSIGKPGMIEAYGWLYSELADNNFPSQFSDILAPVLREHAVRNGFMASAENRLCSSTTESLSATELSRRIGKSYKVTRDRLEEINAIPQGSRRGVAFVLEPSVTQAFDSPSSNSNGIKLGVGRVQARAIRVSASSHPNFGDDPLKAWLNQLLATAKSGRRGKKTALPTACRNMSVPLPLACNAILNGSLPATRVKGFGLGLYCLYVDQTHLGVLRKPKTSLTLKAICRKYSIHDETARFLRDKGAFAKNGPDPAIDEEKVSEFFRQHVTAAALARARATSAKSLIEKLARLGILPAFRRPECRQVIFRRADVDPWDD